MAGSDDAPAPASSDADAPKEPQAINPKIFELLKERKRALSLVDETMPADKNNAEKAKMTAKVCEMYDAQIDKLSKQTVAKTVDTDSAGSSVVIPRKEHYRQEFRKQLAEEQVESQDAVNMMDRLRSLDFQMNEKKSEYKKALKLYTLVASLITILILMLSSAIIVISAWDVDDKDTQEQHHSHIVLIFSSLITLLTGILTYSNAEGKVALLRQAIKRIDALQTRIRVLTKFHFPETLSYGTAADELQRINNEYIEVKTSLVLPCRVSEWGEYCCCFTALLAECTCKGTEDDVTDVRDDAYARREQRFKDRIYPAEAPKYSIKVVELIQDRKQANVEADKITDDAEKKTTKAWIKKTYDDKIYAAKKAAEKEAKAPAEDEKKTSTKILELIKERNTALAMADKIDRNADADKDKTKKWILQTYQAKMEDLKAEVAEERDYEKTGHCCWASTKKKAGREGDLEEGKQATA